MPHSHHSTVFLFLIQVPSAAVHQIAERGRFLGLRFVAVGVAVVGVRWTTVCMFMCVCEDFVVFAVAVKRVVW